MVTVLLYLLVMALVGGTLFVVASVVFGRGEEMAAVPPSTTVTALPSRNVTGADVQDLRFQQTLRGYKASEVDWALDRLGVEIDSLRAQLAEARAAGDTDAAGDAEAAGAEAPITDHADEAPATAAPATSTEKGLA
ncbi:DivIVA domain-containing protein [Rhodococcus triatomae]